jgi:hypothetical protein
MIKKIKEKSIPSKDTVDHNDKMISRKRIRIFTTPNITAYIH